MIARKYSLEVRIDSHGWLIDLNDYVVSECSRLLTECIPITADASFAVRFSERAPDAKAIVPEHIPSFHLANDFGSFAEGSLP